MGFQSHLGSIAARESGPALCIGYVFQSHLGSIAASSAGSRCGCSQTLSIPPWFDCGASSQPLASRLTSFQSHLGSIAASTMLRLFFCRHHFQSHLGSIAARVRLGADAVPVRLSIPPWFDCGGARVGGRGDSLFSFNPTLVRLRRQAGPARAVGRTPFNPTLVRLRRGERHGR